jgi:hypothetical protein
MTDLNESLNVILEEGPPGDGWHLLDSATDLVRQLQNAQQLVADLQHKLSSLKTRMAGDFALALRRTKPGLNVAVDKNSCKVGYKTKMLQFWPEVELGVWRVTSPNRRFLREFLQANRRSTLLTADLSILVNAVAAYFTNYYRTLGEDVTGTGVIMVEDRKVTLVELARWRIAAQKGEPTRPLNTRLARREAVKAC